MGGTYSFVKTASANLREQEDTWNTAIGGFFSGAILGFRGKTLKKKKNLRFCVNCRSSTDFERPQSVPSPLFSVTAPPCQPL